jgi:2-amino-4-hydroxy-6-hydroxymethyldihydropteridine diphosphokinase
MTRSVGIALGSNIEPRLLYLSEALRRIRTLADDPVCSSRVYETSPVGCPPGTAPFLNAVVEIQTTLEPLDLLRPLRTFEEELGRTAVRQINAPRTIDLDVLYYDTLTLSTPELTLPHPRLTTRRFVLAPLADLRPDLVLPGTRQSVRELLDSLKSTEELSVYSNAIY